LGTKNKRKKSGNGNLLLFFGLICSSRNCDEKERQKMKVKNKGEGTENIGIIWVVILYCERWF
jgi:hypothetical protein